MYTEQLPGAEEPYLVFKYQVIRVWQLAVDPLLNGGLSMLPLAPISRVAVDDLPRVVQRMKARLQGASSRGQAERLWTATYVLMGLRYERAFTERLLGEVLGMEESVTYQAIVAKGRLQGIEIGRVKEARDVLLRVGRKHFQKAAPARIRKRIEAMDDRQQLEELLERLLDANAWEELLVPLNTKG